MTSEIHFNDTARQSTGVMTKNRISEKVKQQNAIATDRADEMAVNFVDIKTEKQRDGTAEKRKATMDEREVIQAAQEKAKEEAEKLDGLWEIRARFKNLAEHVLPKNPYLMGIPNKIHITTHEGPDWRRGTPFSPHEERVQYVSFQRLDDDETVLRPQSWDEENAKSSQSGSTRRTSSDFSSLPGQTPRKKMSMEEYLRRKNPDSGSATVSQEGTIVQHKAEAKIGREANMGPTINPKTSSVEAEAPKVEGKAAQRGALESKAQESIRVAATRKDIPAEKKGAPKGEGTGQKESVTSKRVTTQKDISVQQENVLQKLSVVPKEGHRGKKIAGEKEAAMEKILQPPEGRTSPSRKR